MSTYQEFFVLVKIKDRKSTLRRVSPLTLARKSNQFRHVLQYTFLALEKILIT